MARGFGGMPGNLQGLMKQAQKLQEDMQKIQAEAELHTVEASSGGGMVKVVATGKNQISTLAIDPQVAPSADVEMLQDLIVAAVNEALRKVQENYKEKMAAVSGGIQIPGMF